MVKPARPTQRASKPQAGRRSPPSRTLAWLAAAALVLLGAQAVQLQLRKAEQRLYAAPTAKLPHGDADGQVLGTLAVAGDAGGRFYHLDESAGQWRLQRFGPGLIWQATRRGPLKAGQHVAGMAVGPDGTVLLAIDDGVLLQLNARLERPQAKAGFGPLTGFCGDGQGGSWSLRGQAPTLQHLDAQGKELALSGALSRMNEPTAAMAAGADGELAVLIPKGKQLQQVRIYGADGALKSRFEVPLPPAPEHKLALAGGFVLLNENRQGRGLTVYSSVGRYVGQLTNLGPRDLIALQGFVGADVAKAEGCVGHNLGLSCFSTRGWRP